MDEQVVDIDVNIYYLCQGDIHKITNNPSLVYPPQAGPLINHIFPGNIVLPSSSFIQILQICVRVLHTGKCYLNMTYKIHY